ncbi:MAG: CRTAC1 family protein [Verrucomicrobia bacterium]|nr:CRTAC1 family protein [Verrucomicrobiota bacterium]MBI3869422.1 CRTAC1 family protein [Verrucomicrobiota bacterium]
MSDEQTPFLDPSDPDTNSTDELAHADDAVIGRAFRVSAVVAALIVVGAGGALWVKSRSAPKGKPRITVITAPVVAEKRGEEAPTIRFTDITAASGIRFVHNNGAQGEKLLPETMGSGVAFLDYDGDGDQDLLFVNSTWWPGKAPSKEPPTSPALYQNDGKGNFKDVTAEAGLNRSFFGTGVAVGDFDNDGHVDIFFTAVGGNHLYHNDGNGHFTETTAAAGVGGAQDGWSTCAAFADIDNDGDLDLFVGNYVRWSRDIDFQVGYKIDGVTRAYGPPMNFSGAFPYLYRNDGGGKFTDISESSGMQVKNAATGVPVAKTLGVAPIDLNHDGLIDWVVANDTTPNLVFTNAGGGKFVEIGQLSGIAFDSYGNTRGAMGVDAAFYRNDRTLGVVIGNFANEMIALYASQQDRCLFTDAAISEGIGPASRLLLKFGVFFFDYDLDGRLDVLSANGHLEAEINKIQKSQRYRQPAQLFWNTGSDSGACFVNVGADKAGPDLFKPIVGRGSAYADIDGDGDEDVVITQVGAAPILLRNDQETGNNWFRLVLQGTKSNRDAIGAWVRVRMGDRVLLRQVMPTRSYLSQSELPVTIGLGKQTRADAVEIEWPGGRVQSIPMPPLKASTVVREP